MMDRPELDFELMAELDKNDTLARLVIAQADYWLKVGFHKGFEAANKSMKAHTFLIFGACFFFGWLAGAYPW